MATPIRQLRGTTAENDAYTGAAGVITVDETRKELRVHDGGTPGGLTVPRVAKAAGDSVLRPIVEVLLDRPPSATWYGMSSGGDATANKIAFNKACAANRAVSIPPGTFEIDGTLKAKSGAWLEGVQGWEQTRIVRKGLWAGNTLEIGDNVEGQGSYAFRIKDLLFSHPHAGYVAGTSTSLVNRITDGSGHLLIFGGTNGKVERCWFEHSAFGVSIKGGCNIGLHECHFTGSWDDELAAMCEMVAAVRIANDAKFGIATMHHLRDCYINGVPSADRTLTDGAATWTSHRDAGPAYGVLIEGAEGLEITGGYIGANNRNSIRIEPNSPAGIQICQNIDIHDVFFDACTLYSIYFGSVDGSFSNLAHIHHNRFNGQRQAQGVLDMKADAQVVRGLKFDNNIAQGHLRAPLRLVGCQLAKIQDNLITAYNDRRGGDALPTFSAGAYISEVGREVHFSGNTWGYDLNAYTNANNGSKWGPYFTGAFGSAHNERGLFGQSGGSVVGGIAQTNPT